MSEYKNVNISGTGNAPGGQYDTISIDGMGKISGAAVCRTAEISGAGTIEGDLTVLENFCCDGSGHIHGTLKAKSIEVDGSVNVQASLCAEKIEINGAIKVEKDTELSQKMEIDGSFRTEGNLQSACLFVDGVVKVKGNTTIQKQMEVDGSVCVEGCLQTDELEVDGRCEVKHGISARKISVSGLLKSEADVQAEELRSTGVLKIDGLLNAEIVDIALSGDSYVESIGGGKVQVRKEDSEDCFIRIGNLINISLGGSFLKNRRQHLATNLIEADEIEIEYTDAQIVRGVKVHIGPECVIDRVEYSGTLSVDANATVRERVKL